MEAIETPLAGIFEKLPKFPDSARATISTIYPWVLIIFGILGVLGLLVLFGFSAFSAMIGAGGGDTMMYSVIMGVAAVVEIAAGFLMLKKLKRGWDLALYSVLIGAVGYIVGMHFFSLVWTFVQLWLLFNIRDFYTDGTNDSSIM